MKTTKTTIEHLLGHDIVSLEIQDVLGKQIIYLTYQNNIPASAVQAHVCSLHHEAEFGELIRIFSDDVICKTYTELYGDTQYDRYWEDPDVGERIDTWLSDKYLTKTLPLQKGDTCNPHIANGVKISNDVSNRYFIA